MLSAGEKISHYRDLLRFFIIQRFKGLTVPDEPHLDAIDLFMSLIRDCQFYLEYGSGGSTVVAARLGKPFISVDSDRFFFKAVSKKIGTLSPDQLLVHADIGLTGIWGIPLLRKNPTSQKLQKWKAYAGTPWRFIKNDRLPDLVLIDGRFRVASALTCFARLAAFPDARILVDDYAPRPHYHVMEKYANLRRIVDGMAIFQPSPQDVQKLSQTVDRYSADWR